MRHTARLGWDRTDIDFQHHLYRGRRFCAPTFRASVNAAAINARRPRQCRIRDSNAAAVNARRSRIGDSVNAAAVNDRGPRRSRIGVSVTAAAVNARGPRRSRNGDTDNDAVNARGPRRSRNGDTDNDSVNAS